MPESHTEQRSSDRVNKPALPPFGGQIPVASPILRPATDLRGRLTLPPFFGQLIQRGGPLPGSKAQVVAAAAPAAPEAAQLPATATPATPLTATPATPAWDTPPMPMLATAPAVEEAPAPGGEADLVVPSEYATDAEWAPPTAEPLAHVTGDATGPEHHTSESASAAAPSEASSVPFGMPTFDESAEPELPADPEYAVTAPPSADPVGGYAPPPLPLAPSPWTSDASSAVQPAANDGLFADTPLGTPEVPSSTDNEFPYDLSANVMSDDITDMFAERYAAPPPVPMPEPLPGQRRPARKTPVLGAPPVEETPTSVGRAQMAARIGRRATPVLGSPPVTPLQNPVIRRTPMGGAIAAIEPAALDRIGTPLPLASLAPMPTPVAVPAMQDLSASRAVAHALETVAARVRAGQLVVVGDVPVGDDVSSLAAGIAAALAALLGVQR